MEKQKILIVDDEPINIFVLEGILSEEGFEVLTAQNGNEALIKVVQMPPDVILLDIMMPDMSGIEVLEILTADPKTNHIPIIMVTAKTDSEDVQLALSKGAIEYIKKPVDGIEMLARLHTVLRLKQQEDLLRDQLHSKEEFISMVSHDMRAPLLSVTGLAEMLLNEEVNETHKKVLNTIINSSNFIIDYFNKLLNWSKLGAKELILSKKYLQLNELANITQVIFSLQVKQKKQNLIIDCEPTLQIFADESYMQQVLNNLVSNAVKYTPDGGTITILVRKKQGAVLVKITDTGIGMTGITAEELFGYAFHKSTRGTKGEKGTGVGLRICKLITEAHGFELSYQSEPGKGTEFIITIPL
jgi:two-component system, sensor histidine kinase and response regulator